jgi:glycosyltransferase involved in cell wall biosynthesis
MENKKIIFVASVDWAFLSHRLPLALEAKKRGYQVIVYAVEENNLGNLIESYGFKFVPLPTSRSGSNIIKELRAILFLIRAYKKEKPLIVHHITIKPVTYGSIATRVVSVPLVVNALTGMGYLFINSKRNFFQHRIVMRLFKVGFNNKRMHFIFQNQDDLKIMDRFPKVKKQNLHLIKGSGVDVNEFAFKPVPETSPIKVLLLSRMLWDKGIAEFVAAAREIIMNKLIETEITFILAGGVDLGNRAGITVKQLEKWNEAGFVKWIGHQTDVRKHIEESHIVVLPSYREGLPKSLIEACAIGRPVITTDVPGCRDVVENGVNGYLVPPKEHTMLAQRIVELCSNKELREKMGAAGREKAENEFSVSDVIEKTFVIYQLANNRS